MSNTSDFVIENGVLIKYVGPGGEVVIPDGVAEIYATAGFQGNDSITELTIPEGVERLQFYTFQNCRNLRRVILPSSISMIGSAAFKGCERLEEIVLPERLERIKENAFQDCISLKSIRIPENVSSIGTEAFQNCKNLKQVEICPERISAWGDNVFAGCKGLLDSQGLLILGETMLCRYEGSGGSVSIPQGVKHIQNAAFKSRKKLSGVVMPEGVESIGAEAFAGCVGLRSVILPGTLKEIQEKAFKGCKMLAELDFPASLRTIEEEAFRNCETLGRVVLPLGVEKVGKNAFAGCTGVEYIELPQKINKSITGIFSQSEMLEKRIQSQLSFSADTEAAFLAKIREKSNRTKLMQSFIAQDNGPYAAWLLEQLAKTLTEEELDTYIEAAAAQQKPQVQAVFLNYKNKDISAEQGLQLELPDEISSVERNEMTVSDWRKIFKFSVKDGKASISGYKGTEVDVQIPAYIGKNPVTEIADGAFFGREFIESLTIPEGVSYIGRQVFDRCCNLKDLHLPASVARIDSYIGSMRSKLTIHAPVGSYAEQYAKEHNIPFVAE